MHSSIRYWKIDDVKKEDRVFKKQVGHWTRNNNVSEQKTEPVASGKWRKYKE
jgi:hypothetical protein